MKRRILTIALAVVMAIVGVAGVLSYVHQADARDLAGQRAVTVIVAGQQIPAGTAAGQALSAGDFRSETLPASSVPANAVRSITPDLTDLVTSTVLAPGELLLRPALGVATQVTSGLSIPPGMVAVTIQLCLPATVADYLQAGSEVAIFDTSAAGTAGDTLTDQTACQGPHKQQSGSVTSLILPRVQVLAMGAASDGSPSSGSSSSQSSSDALVNELVTLAVSQADAQRVILLTESGLPYLALVNASSTLNVNAGAATLSSAAG
jgi:pilus assembly protein CpaB